MQFIFADSIPKAQKEFDDCLNNKHKAKLEYIEEVINIVGFDNVQDKFVKHLWNDVYELRPHDGRVIFIKIHQDTTYIIGAYIKKSNKMPQNIQNTLKEREQTLLNSL